VGHSAGGFAISAAAASPLVAGLVFVAAYVPKPGLSLADMRRAGPSQPLRGSFRLTEDRRAYGFAAERCKDLFFHDCPDATDRLCLEPIAPQETPLVHLRALPRAAVICTEDRAIPPDYQRDMAAGMVQETLPSGHCPFLSMPDALAASLHRLIGQMGIATDFVAG
jgi:pimeloyl-ACP methyl ester carboxylesterase